MKQRGRKPKCPYCRGNRTIRKGVRKTVTLGDRPLCVCRDCQRKFTLNRPAVVASIGVDVDPRMPLEVASAEEPHHQLDADPR